MVGQFECSERKLLLQASRPDLHTSVTRESCRKSNVRFGGSDCNIDGNELNRYFATPNEKTRESERSETTFRVELLEQLDGSMFQGSCNRKIETALPHFLRTV